MSPMLLMTQYGSDTIMKEAAKGVSFLSSLMLFLIGLFIAFIIVIYFIDKTQTKDSVRRNYPVLGRFRGIFTELGEFFRQYFFAMDREEMPFNRAQRDYINDVSDDGHETVPFEAGVHYRTG